MTPADLRREAEAARARAEAESRDAWHRTVYGACIVSAAFGATTEAGEAPAAHHYLPWLEKPEAAEGTGPGGSGPGITPENVDARFMAALARAGYPTPP